jgi:transcriptional regulator with XRE-family HTH domain
MHGHDDLPTLTAGQQIRLFRERAGMTRAVLAGLVGKSPDWIKSVETGRIMTPRLTMLGRIARALKVPVQALITEDEQVVLSPGAAHAALPAVREALNRWPGSTGERPPSLEHIAARLAVAWRARHASPDHRTVIGGLLPDLIRDAQLAARHLPRRRPAPRPGPARRRLRPGPDVPGLPARRRPAVAGGRPGHARRPGLCGAAARPAPRCISSQCWTSTPQPCWDRPTSTPRPMS